MNVKAIVFDLDNTIFSVYSIGDKLFKPLFDLIHEKGEYKGDLDEIKRDTMRMPFQKVASKYQFSKTLIKEGLIVLNSLKGDLRMDVFEDYSLTQKISCPKFLVTVGFPKMQQGKINSLGIRHDFEEIHIVDPQKTNQTKKEVFQDLMERYQYKASDLLVVGDDPNSEIKAAMELGIPVVLYDKLGFNPHRKDLKRITDYKQLVDMVLMN